MSLKPSLPELRSLGHHQTTYDWGIQFISLPSLVSGFTSSDLNTRCQSSKLPAMQFDNIPIDLRGHRAFQHGIGRYDDNTLNIVLYETVDSKVQDFLSAWSAIQWTPETGSQVPKMLNQAAFLLTLLNSEHQPVRYYTIIGAWLESWSPSGQLQSSSSDILSFTCNFRFDYFLTSKKR